ncbi:MAG: malto-oligosyltrehalose trehalohydrolase, partial [Salinimicrobium sp.]
SVEVIIKGRDQPISLTKDEEGYWETETKDVKPGDLYKFRLDGEDDFPDPASKAQPEGVHSWSQLTDPNSFKWQDRTWKGRELDDMIIYELHVGTFTKKGTFEAIIEKLDHLEELGVNTLELMPLAQFPGDRNWGYDGVYPFAAQDSYGGIAGLKKLIDECHRRNFSVLLDVVYNHLGPEGNYISQYGPYFTDKYHTPWGSAINFDDEYSDQVRNHFVQNALMWLEEFHFDGLRLDAIHEIIDRGARHFLKELSEEVDLLEEKIGRRLVLIAESDLNDIRIIKPYEKGGYGLEGQWVDDFHHAVHTLLTGEDAGYYKDYGKMEFLAKAFRQAFIYDGIYSNFRKKSVGNSPKGLPKSHFVVCIQNHDQVGNRLLGERLSQLVSFEKQKLAAGIMLTSGFVPMLFMGEEFAEQNPFQYFVSHGDKDLVKAVQEGRKREFEYFFHEGHSDKAFPDPQSRETFEASRLNWDFRKNERQNLIFEYYKELLRLRKEGNFDLFRTSEVKTEFDEEKMLLKATAAGEEEDLVGFFNFGSADLSEAISKDIQPKLLFASADKKWGGEMQPENLIFEAQVNVPKESFLVYKT